jgi:hypothetical protein
MMQGASVRPQLGPNQTCSWRLRLAPLPPRLVGVGVSLKTAYLYAMVFSCRCEPSLSHMDVSRGFASHGDHRRAQF